MEECLAQSRYREEGLGPATNDMAGFLDSPWKALHSLRNGWRLESGENGRVGGKEGEGTWIGI